ncbi:MAG: hypothetical protein Q9160_007679 [Pyrenula sp. 1 TL-2023]
MAEALVSIGLAANIFQFVGYGISIISDTREIYHSASGAKDENVELEHVISNVVDINEQIIAGASAYQLLDILQKLKPSNDANFSKLEALHKALKSAAKKREIEDLERRLRKIENQASFRLMALLSGKSTLMKYAIEHEATLGALEDWAGSKHLVTASYFFWGIGSFLQKSYEGLLRSLLYQIFKSCPVLLTESCMQADHRSQWTIQDLDRILHLVLTRAVAKTKFCFFIDGLDEYQGDITDVLDSIRQMAEISNVKLCISSRPWDAFQIAFRASCYKLCVENLTRHDLQRYVRDGLTKDTLFQKVVQQEPHCEDLISNITNKAEGVFLWVYLVVRNLLRDL